MFVVITPVYVGPHRFLIDGYPVDRGKPLVTANVNCTVFQVAKSFGEVNLE